MNTHTIPAVPRVCERFTNAQIIAFAQQHGFTRKTESDMGMASWHTLHVKVGDGTRVLIDDIHPLYQHAVFAPPAPDWDAIGADDITATPVSAGSRMRQAISALARWATP